MNYSKCGIRKMLRVADVNKIEKKVYNKLKGRNLKLNLLIGGNSGTGKTMIAICQMIEAEKYKDFYDKSGVLNIFFVSISELALEIRQSIKDGNEFSVIEKYKRYRMLVLDDLGSEKNSEYSIGNLYIILNSREQLGRPTIVTTNLTSKSIIESYGQRIFSRLSSGDIIKVDGVDRRKVQKNKIPMPELLEKVKKDVEITKKERVKVSSMAENIINNIKKED